MNIEYPYFATSQFVKCEPSFVDTIMASLFLALLLIDATISDFPKIIQHGTNIHFTNPQPGVAQEMSESYSIIRMDFSWQGTEQKKGVYNYDAYDILYNSLSSVNIRPYWILDYGNPLYNQGNAPTTAESISAFTNWTLASLTHFKNKGIIWELWNEPNIGFWKPSPNATQYGTLALAVGAAIRANSTVSNEVFVGPTTSGIDYNFMTTIFKMGVLKYFDGVSCHPYRCGCPESVTQNYLSLRSLIDEYNPNSTKYIPIISSEWGWPTCYNTTTGGSMQCIGWNCDEIVTYERQSQWLIRQWIINNMNNITVSIFYDFKNDGNDLEQREQNFGTVGYEYNNESLPFVHKLSFDAAMTYHNMFEKDGDNKYFGWSQYLISDDIECDGCNKEQVRIIRFGNDGDTMTNMVAWYSIDCVDINDYNGPNINITVNNLNIASGCWMSYDLFGNDKGKICTSNNGQSVEINNVNESPIYLVDYQKIE